MGEVGHLELLRIVGEALHGERWQSPIAADLGVSDRAIRYWISAANQCPEDLGVRLLAIIVRRSEALADLETVVRERLKLIGGP